MTLLNGGQDLAGEFFGKEDGAFGLTAGAEIPCPAAERQKMPLMTFCAFAFQFGWAYSY
jgi:hypothetical protein